MQSTTNFVIATNNSLLVFIKLIIMATLKYKVITSKSQYKEYSNVLEELVFSGSKDRNAKDEIALLTLLIEKWDAEHNTFDELGPIQLLHSLMEEHNMKAKDLVSVLDHSKGYVSDILNYKKGLSKEVIRKLADHFKVSQEAFNRPYKLVVPENSHLRNASVMNTPKKIGGNRAAAYG
jgi:HTH-type transcriptional regulator/antitoxin HigA